LIKGGRGFTYTCTFSVQYIVFTGTSQLLSNSIYEKLVIIQAIGCFVRHTLRLFKNWKGTPVFQLMLFFVEKISFSVQFFCFRDPSGPCSFTASLLSLQVTKGKFATLILKVHKRENFLGSDIEICTFS
jgi:hypothetical protein